MSEDVDIKLIPLPCFNALSRAGRKRERKKSIGELEQAIKESEHFQIKDKKVRDESRSIAFAVQYPQQFNIAPCLRPIIKLELMETNLLHDSESCPIYYL